MTFFVPSIGTENPASCCRLHLRYDAADASQSAICFLGNLQAPAVTADGRSARRGDGNDKGTKNGKRRDVAARLSYSRACEFGFRGSLDQWERLMGAATRP